MAVNTEITRNVELVRNATYGKDVREAIARGLELCYGYTSGETADEAAQRANNAAAAVEAIIDDSREALEEIQTALGNIDDIVKVSPDEPTEELNKIWIQPQDETEYKVATYAAYSYLWDQMVEMHNTYEQGHGGITSVEEDTSYQNPEDTEERRYVINYSDNTTGEIFIDNGKEGPIGPLDTIVATNIYYKKVKPNLFTPTPPTDYSSNLPALDPGDYLWTISEIVYLSGATSYIYGLTRMGLNGADGEDGKDGENGTGAVRDVAIAGQAAFSMTDGHVIIPVDVEPNVGSNNLMTSGAIYNALQNAVPLDSPAFMGTPTAPTPTLGDDSTKIATTEFVQNTVNAKTVSAKQVTLTMNDSTLTYVNPNITDDTAVLGFMNIDYSKFYGPISWTTSDGQLVLTTEVAPSEPVTFKIILMDAVDNET